ncbi:cyclophilin-like fold protein [Terrabacter sp. GCM10028922]|uniref:cyclophilin-like fold protein n=1 Tax=Terrabacter sp. GCM10028922 TaxID=3273428 RepID=UPI00361B3024
MPVRVEGPLRLARRCARSSPRQWPWTLILNYFHGTERIAYPPRPLETTDAPTGMAPTAGDIAYFAPWGNVAMYYADAADDAGLVPLGRLDPRAADALAGLDENATVIIRLA